MIDFEMTRRSVLRAAMAGAALIASRVGSTQSSGSAQVGSAQTQASVRPNPGKVTLEEHFAFPGSEATTFQPIGIDPKVWKLIEAKLADVEQYRLPEMDANGVKMQVVSLTADGIQGETNVLTAITHAKQANDWLAEKYIAKHPTRFAGFAAVPLQNPKAAADELERAVKELGLKGALINGYTNTDSSERGEYLDLPKFEVFWERANALEVPVYLHPRLPLPSQRLIYEGHDELLGPMWAFGTETAVHALRLITSGLFDRYPKQQMILGHMGEGLVAMMARAQRRFEYAPCGKVLKKPLSQYLRDNFHITTSGNFDTNTLNNVIAVMGIDRVMFSVDFPYEDMKEGADWFDACPLHGEERLKVSSANARKLLKLPEA